MCDTKYVIPEEEGTDMTAGSGIIDMHVHTDDSPDADIPAAELAARATAGGLLGVGFVAHVDFHPADYCTGAFSAEAYSRALALAGEVPGSPALLAGIEIGEPHLYMSRAMESADGVRLDFVTGALHWIGDRLLLDASGFEGADPRELVEEYLRICVTIAEGSPIDILAHLGIWRRGLARLGPVDIEEASLWPGLLGRLFEAMVDRGIALEVNTAGLRRPESTTYPSASVIRLYRKCGGRHVTIGSDTHSETHVFFGLSEGARVLAAEGFTEACGFRDRRPFVYQIGT